MSFSTTTRRWNLGVVLAGVLGWAACGGSTPMALPDAGPDLAVETTPEAPAEVAVETSPEVAMDAAPEVDPACQTIAPDATRTVHLRITTDNECEVFVNGQSVGTTTSWPSPVTIDVSLFIHPGRINVVAVRGTNTSSQGGNDRGILGELAELTDAGSTPVLVTDGDWRVSKVEEAGWTALAFDDSAWIKATVVAAHGDPPWGALLGTSAAKWIWSAAVPADTADKPNVETAYARRVFYFTADGTGIVSTPGCPAPVGLPR